VAQTSIIILGGAGNWVLEAVGFHGLEDEMVYEMCRVQDQSPGVFKGGEALMFQMFQVSQQVAPGV
jgi:hypothetical protein